LKVGSAAGSKEQAGGPPGRTGRHAAGMRMVRWCLGAGAQWRLRSSAEPPQCWASLSRLPTPRSMAAEAQHPDGGVCALDRAAFTQVVQIQALRVPTRDCQRYLRLMTG